MAEIIDLPQQGSGTAQQQLEEMYRYLYRLAKDLNLNFEHIGNASVALTSEEQQLMNDLTRAEMTDVQKAEDSLYAGKHNYAEAETLKSLIIKTAQFVKDEVQNIRAVLYGEESASGQFGDWKRKKGLRVDVTPDGVKQTYSYAEIVQGHQTFEINSKNYIKTGFLRTESSLPVYGVQVGKDIVTFDENGNETYNDENKVAEFTADALSFFHNGVILAKYSGTKTSFYAGGDEVMYIQAGKIYATVDLELGSGKSVKVGNWRFDGNGQTYYENDTAVMQLGNYANMLNNVQGGFFVGPETQNEDPFLSMYVNSTNYYGEVILQQQGSEGVDFMPKRGTCNLGGSANAYNHWSYCWLDIIFYSSLQQQSSRDIKHDIEDMPDMGEQLDALRPVTFVYDDDQNEKKRYGLIYEEAKEVLPDICTDDEGNKAISYMEMVPMMLKEIQSLRARVSALEGGNG
jgi:hypothetical protein